VIAALLLACGGDKHLDTAIVQVDGHPVTVELAINGDQRATGLMHRETMGADEGMLFVYVDEKPRSFWMKDTSLPLTIAYADRHGVIVKILDMTPFSTDSVQSVYPAMYALEMNQGWFASHDVVAGDAITGIPAVKAE
jgi:uncharacterized membrane protein (UPF0127 family)